MKKLSLLTGFAAGYVLGAKAGTERYTQIMEKVDEVMGKPQVQKATDTITQTATDLGGKAKDTVNDKVESVSGTKKSKTVDLNTTTAPMAGAAASGAAPDVAMSTGATGAKTAPTGGITSSTAPGTTTDAKTRPR